MNLKQQAAQNVFKYVHDDMIIGLGTGSTTAFFIEMLGEKLLNRELKNIVGVPTSEATRNRAKTLGIKLTTLTENPVLDLAVDGADEVDPQLNLIKGLGRALLREKIVEVHARRFIVIVDESKLVKRLGMKCSLPVEIVPFEALAHVEWLSSLGCEASLWLEEDGEKVITDNKNHLALCKFESGIKDVYDLARKLEHRPGIIEHGLFLDMADIVIVAESDGINILERDY